jgi:hypothetical protein
LPLDAHAPHVVGDSASEWFDASYVFTPLPECLPSQYGHGTSLLTEIKLRYTYLLEQSLLLNTRLAKSRDTTCNFH